MSYADRCSRRSLFISYCKDYAWQEYNEKMAAATCIERVWRRYYYSTRFHLTVHSELNRYKRAAIKIQHFFRAKAMLFLLKIFILRCRSAGEKDIL